MTAMFYVYITTHRKPTPIAALITPSNPAVARRQV
jgi:hypothetical protein